MPNGSGYLGAGEFIAPQPGFPIHPGKFGARGEKITGASGKMLIPAKEGSFCRTNAGDMLSKPQLYAHPSLRWAG